MKNPVSTLISIERTYQVINQLKSQFKYSIDQKKHRINFETVSQEEFYLRLPLPFPLENQYIDLEDCETPYLICIIQSGSAAMAYCEGLQVIEHKVFKAYMVRKKQGKSQIKYLKTKGKSKAGSRVRLGNTVHFFEEITGKLNDWLSYYEIEKIALSLNKTLYPYLFNKENEVLSKNDERIFKIPKHIEEPSFENLLKIHSYLLKAELIYDKSLELMLEEFLKDINE